MSGEGDSELRPAYRTLDEPTRLLGVSLGGWAALLLAGGVAYGWLMLSPLAWRANLSIAVIGLGAPLALLLLREQSTISPGRLLAAVVRWRAPPTDRDATRWAAGASRRCPARPPAARARGPGSRRGRAAMARRHRQ